MPPLARPRLFGHSPTVSPPDFHQLLPGLWVWQNYDSAVKADLFSSAIRTRAGIYIVDPIALADANLRNLSEAATVAGIIVTNANHSRASLAYSDRFSAPVLADAQSFPDLKPARFTEAKKSTAIGGELEIIEIEGAVAGEVAIYHASNGGTLIVGDALINFEPYGFSFLPRKYCLNQKQMWSSLRELLARPAERLLFAHGVPILSGATARLRRLLDVDH
jgi:glyoxylase-like metal-dependent hydrolase (beta-lactamase superfamily II)